MDIWNIFGVIGGLAIFLNGMIFMNENILRAAGRKLREILLSLTGGRIRGFLTGLGLTCIIQSSSATTVMEVGLVGAGLLTFYQSLAVTLGAELGTTITAQLVAFRITKYALLICAIGFFSSLVSKTRKGKSTARAILGFGLLFLGLDIMSKSLYPLRKYEVFLNLMSTIEAPIIGILFGLFFTCIIQSSSATSGIVTSMAMTGTLTFSQAVPINLGASIGTSITAFLASLPLNRDAKRTAYAHTIFQTIGVIIVVIAMLIPFGEDNLWFNFVRYITKTILRTDDVAKQVAMAHTLMPLVKGIILLPILYSIGKLLYKIYPSREIDKPFGPMYISDTLITTPTLALEQAKKEIVRTAQIVNEMFSNSIVAFEKKDAKLSEQISLMDIKVDILRNAIVPFLTKVAQQDLSEEESNREVAHLYIINELEAVGDIIDKNIMPLARKMISAHLNFSSEGWDDIYAFHQKVKQNFDDVIQALMNNDVILARKVADMKPEIGRYESELRMRHIQRLHRGQIESMDTSAIHFDLIDQYKRINSHIASIGYILLGQL